MFTKETIFNKIVSTARKDIRDFFETDFNCDFDRTVYVSFLDTLRQIDPTYFTHKFTTMGTLEFVDKLLRWLEDTREELRSPWTKKHGSNIELSQDANARKIRSFLIHLKGWINRLVSPGDLKIARPSNPFFTGQKLWGFKNFIGQQRLANGKWDISIQAAHGADKKLLRGFVSWLVLVKNEPVLYIIYDKEKILSHNDVSSVEGWVVCRSRNRRIILHEVGHARSELPWYLDHVNSVQKTTWVCSYPIHEYEAWLYALTIRSLLVCIRSRITRFIEDGDTEWLAYV